MASIYDQLGIISSSHVLGRVIYSKVCNERLLWDVEAPEHKV